MQSLVHTLPAASEQTQKSSSIDATRKMIHHIVTASYFLLLISAQGAASFVVQPERSPVFRLTVAMSTDPLSPTKSSEEKDLKPTLGDRFSHNFEMWALKNPERVGPLRRLLFNALSFYELAKFGASGKEQWRKRLVFGRNFVFGGAVFCGE